MGEEAAGHRRRRMLIGFALIAIVLGVGVWLLVRSGGDPSPPTAASGPPPAVSSPPPAVPAGSEAEAEVAADEPLPEPIRRYLETTPYPPDSGRLTENHGDLLRPNSRHERPLPIPDSGPEPEEIVDYLFTADRYAYLSDQTARVRLEVEYRGPELPVRILEASIIREGRSGDVGGAVRLPLAWQGEHFGADVPLEGFADHHGTLRMDVVFEYAPERRHHASMRLFLTPVARVPAKFTGEFGERLFEGSLRVDVGVQIEEAGFYRFDANLFGLNGQPVAFAHFKGRLGHDDQSFPLTFYGKVLRDVGAVGPFRLGNLRGYRFLDGFHPDRERLAEPSRDHVTAAYSLNDFTDVHHTSAHEKAMVELMLEDVARGISLDVPGPAALP